MKKQINLLLIIIILSLSINTNAQSIKKWKLADLQSFIANVKEPTIINFWATFCKPCIKEIPYFQQIVKKYKDKGVRLVLVSLDLKEAFPAKITRFAKARKLQAPLYYLDETNADLFCPVVDKSWSGAIPASLFLNNKTGYHKFFEEELSLQLFESNLKEMIQ